MKTDSDAILNIVTKMDNGSPNTGYQLIKHSSGSSDPGGGNKLYVFLISTYNSDMIVVYGSTDITDLSWHHVVVTYNGSATAAGVQIYVDGTPETMYTRDDPGDGDWDTVSGSILNDLPLQISGREGINYAFDGLIDEVRIWDEALSAEDIGLDLFDATVKAEEDGNSLAVPIDWAYGSPYVAQEGVTFDTEDTEFDLESIIEGTSLTLTAPTTHVEDSTFYVFDKWSWSVDVTVFSNPASDFVITEDTTVTAHYTKVISVDKTLENCCLPTLIETVDVPSNKATASNSTATLESGKSYCFKAIGWAYAGDTIDFDAKYSITNRITGDTWTDDVSGYTSHGPELLDLFVNGSSVDWGAYSADHVYSLDFVGDGSTVDFLINDIHYPNNTGSLAVEIYEACDPSALPLQTQLNFSMRITVHAYAEVTEVTVKDGVGADLVVDSPTDGGAVTVGIPGKSKGKMHATKIAWDIGSPDICEQYTLDIDVHTGLNPKDKQEYTSTGDHDLNSGPEVYFTYDGTPYMLQGPPVKVFVVE